MLVIHSLAYQRLVLVGLLSALIIFPSSIQAQLSHTGDPDNYGYRWIDSDTTGGPDFYWMDISTNGSPGPAGDDDFAQISLPLTFWFYGQAKTSVKISTNGYLTFGNDGTDYSKDSIPNVLAPNDYIAPFWYDLAAGTGDSTIYYYHDVNQNQFIVQYTNVPAWGSGGSNSFQVILDQDGSIVFQYLTMAKTVFLSGNLDARLIPVANVWSSDTPLTVSNNFAVGTDGLNSLDQISTPLVSGDTIAITGKKPDGINVSDTFIYGIDGTTIDNLLTVINMAYGGQVMASLVAGKILFTDVLDTYGWITGTSIEAMDTNTQIALSSTAGIAFPAFENSVPGFTGRASLATDVYDGLGFNHRLIILFTKTCVAGEWRWEAEFVGGDEVIVSGTTGTINFSESGEVVSFDVDGTAIGITVDPGTGAAQFTIQLDARGGKGLAGLTQFASESNLGVTYATIGIENHSGDDGLAVTDNASHRHDNYAIQFVPPVPASVAGIQSYPSGFNLHQNYPNPFNPVTTVRYDLPQGSEVSLVVYDILGREVTRLVEDYVEPGYHQAQLHGRNANGIELPSGIYIARLTTPEYSKSIKMVFLY